MRAVGYGRVSSKGQGDDGYSLEAQHSALSAECLRRGWELIEFRSEVITTRKRIDRRKVIASTLDGLAAGAFDVLMVARLDRLARSSLEFATVLERTEREPWQLVMLDPSVDTTTPYGRAMAQMAAVFAQLERDLIGQRTREGIAQAKRNGTYHNHPPEVDELATERIMRHAGTLSSGAIARLLDEAGMVPPRGEYWSGRTVRKVIARERASAA